MEKIKVKMVLENFISVVFGKLYTPEQKERILNLISLGNGLDKEKTNEIKDVLDELNIEDFYDFATCNNQLLYSVLSDNESSIKCEAVSILYEITKPKPQGQEKPIYYNERIWLNSMLKEKDNLELGYYKYAKGKLAESIAYFEKALKNEASVPIDEYIALISMENEDYTKAYEYSLKAQYIENEKIEVDWLVDIENISKSKISEIEGEKIRKRITNSSESPKIGFSNM